MTRLVRHAIGDGWIDVTARAYSVPEALALEAAIKQVPRAEAFQPAIQAAMLDAVMSGTGFVRLDGDAAERIDPATIYADPPTEDALPPAALADSDDNVGGLKAGEAVP